MTVVQVAAEELGVKSTPRLRRIILEAGASVDDFAARRFRARTLRGGGNPGN